MHAIVVVAKPLQATIKQMVARAGLDLKAAMEMMKICPDKEPSFIGTFEFFASVPDYQDPAANLDRSCPSSPITIDPANRIRPTTTTVETETEPEPETTTTSDTATSTSADPTIKDDSSTKKFARSIASVSHGDGFLSFALMITVCGMLQL